MIDSGFLVLDTGECYQGLWGGGVEKAGEVVFNTSHSGYEEMATDPSYFSQILVATAPMMGNYGIDDEFWESRRLWIRGFICLELQESGRDRSWRQRLTEQEVPILTDLDTRELVLRLREGGTPWGALVKAKSEDEARSRAKSLIQEAQAQDKDWAHLVTRPQPEDRQGQLPSGPKVAVLDFGCKNNILRELEKRCSELRVFPSRSSAEEIRAYAPHGVMLSNGPGDPQDVEVAVETVRDLLGWRFIFGICMGHHILARALGGKTYKLKFGHRGSNHPIRDEILNRIYMTSQNHGYAVDPDSLPKAVRVTHTNLNDHTVSGIFCPEQKILGVQFHPESHPGPHDAEGLFDYFVKQIQ